jgi:hypothetical protein
MDISADITGSKNPYLDDISYEFITNETIDPEETVIVAR